MNDSVNLHSYIQGATAILDLQGVEIDNDFFNSLEEKYTDFDGSSEELAALLQHDIDVYKTEKLAEKQAKEMNEEEKLKEEEMTIEDDKKLEKVIEEAKGEQEEEKEDKKEEEIALDDNDKESAEVNNYDINLMMIAKAETPKDLQEVVSEIPNLNMRLKDLDLSADQFESTKLGLFDLYKDSVIKEAKNEGGLRFNTMEEYKQFDSDDYDSIKLENGKEVDVDSDFSIEDEKEDIALDTDNDIDLSNDDIPLDEHVAVDEDNKEEQETRDVVKEQIKEENDISIMFEEPEVNNMTKEVQEKTDSKEGHKVLKIVPPSEKGFTNSQAINITILIGLLLFFMLLLAVFM